MKCSWLALIILTCGLCLAAAQIQQIQSDPRGPVVNAGMSVRVSSDGVQAVNYHFRPAAAQTALKAAWIWLDPATDASARHGDEKHALAAWFRKEIKLADEPQSVEARVSADSVYRLWINGKLVSRGPADPGNDIDSRFGWSHRWLYDCRNLTAFFHKGRNVIAAEVFRKPDQTTASNPDFATAAPTNPPIKACELLEGIPSSHVTTFQTMAPQSAANMTPAVTISG